MSGHNKSANANPGTIIITGAGSGIGRATARVFLDAGYITGLVGRRDEALLETAGDHVTAVVMPCDVTDADAVSKGFDDFVAHAGRLDVMFNNAGTGAPVKIIDELSIADWDRTIALNVNGAFYCARAAFKIMRHQDPQGGRIINNGSISADVPRPGSAPYTASKHAITGLTRSISLDGRAFNIACGQIDIGNAGTEMTIAMSTGVPQADGSIKPEPMMDVAHVASSVLHMAQLPLDANVQFMTVMATRMPYIGRG